MAGSSVVVHDVEMLEDFGKFLQKKREELETVYTGLLEETLKQRDNWQDPQYEYLKDQISEYCGLCRRQLEELEEFAAYIGGLTEKLRDL